jgi:hypothetical protein
MMSEIFLGAVEGLLLIAVTFPDDEVGLVTIINAFHVMVGLVANLHHAQTMSLKFISAERGKMIPSLRMILYMVLTSASVKVKESRIEVTPAFLMAWVQSGLHPIENEGVTSILDVLTSLGTMCKIIRKRWYRCADFTGYHV